MGYSRILNSLKTVIAVATAFNIAACLVTESAQAIGLGKASGEDVFNPINKVTFDLDFDVQDKTPNDDSLGVFPGAIQNFQNFFVVTGFPTVYSNSSVCGQEVCLPGTLTVTKFSPDSFDFSRLREIPGLNLDQNRLLQYNLGNLTFDFSKDVLRYDVNFGTSSAPELIWFVQSNDSSLINDLSALIKVDRNKIPALLDISFPDVRYTGFEFSIISGQITSQQVPESSMTPALLGLGVLGTVSLLQRNKGFLKSVTQNSSSLSQKST